MDAALNEYAGLREQAQSVDPVQLYEARQAIRPVKEREAENRVQEAYGEKYSSRLMMDSKRDTSRLLEEAAEARLIRERQRQAQHSRKEPARQQQKKRRSEWER